MVAVALPRWVSILGKVAGYLVILLVIYVVFLPFIASKTPLPGGVASYALVISKQTLYFPFSEYVGFGLILVSAFGAALFYLAMYVSAYVRQRGGVGG